MNVSVIGTGYVGLVTGACLASLGMNVMCCDYDTVKIDKLKRGIMPIYEPGLIGVVGNCSKLEFSSKMEDAVEHADIIFIAVNTPTTADNRCDTANVLEAARMIAREISSYTVVIIKSTVPVGTGLRVRNEIKRVLNERNSEIGFDVVSNPEFLREGSAVRDFMYPDRIVIGADNEKAANVTKEVYKYQISHKVPVLVTNKETAELIKYASNAFLAGKISFINEIADLCEQCGADVMEVAQGMGLDGRIGPQFLRPGPGFGGSCFPKDVRALIGMADDYGVEARIAGSVLDVNNDRIGRMTEKIAEATVGSDESGGLIGLKGHIISVLGLAFKPETDDIRDSPAIAIIKELLLKEATVRVYDPQAMDNVRVQYPELEVTYCSDIITACTNCDCIVLATEWEQFGRLDLKELRQVVRSPVIIDLRNLYRPEQVRSYGFVYKGVGRR